jgi:shikimate dehydrogenase
MGFRGGNCAGDYRTAVVPYLDRLSRVAELAQVVNCLLRDDALLVGENTEGQAVLSAIRRRIDPAGQRVVLLGAGRAARAIAVELALAQAGEITILNRGEEAGARLAQLLSGELQSAAAFVPWQDRFVVPAEAQIVIQATSAAEDDEEAVLPLGIENLAPETVVADLTLNPPRTRLVRDAQERDCATVDGLEILVEQAAINFRLWTGLEPNTDVMHDAVEEFLEL